MGIFIGLLIGLMYCLIILGLVKLFLMNTYEAKKLLNALNTNAEIMRSVYSKQHLISSFWRLFKRYKYTYYYDLISCGIDYETAFAIARNIKKRPESRSFNK